MRLGDDRGQRMMLVLLLVALQVGMLFDYGRYVERQPTAEDFAADYQSHVGQTVQFDGTVVARDPLVVAVDDTDEQLELTLHGFDESAERGAAVDVFGTLHANHTVQVTDSVVARTANRLYMFGISFVALLFVVGLGLRDWRFDGRSLVFRKRGDE